jgi:2'-5' RNA ligase
MKEQSLKEPSVRLFFALWPDEQTVAQIMPWVHEAHALCGGRMMRPETLHVTLAFLGNTAVSRIPALCEVAQGWRAKVGEVALQRYGRFAGPQVVWAGPEEDDCCTQWLGALYDDLWARLEPMGWTRPAGPFRPHVSLLRKAGPGDVSALHRTELVWRPAQCVLVASRPREGGSDYEVLACLAMDPL